MMKQKKNNAKSVRMTDEVLAYVESQEGEGFNQKFENMALYAMKTEKERRQRIARLDAEIQRKQDILQTLRQMEDRLTWARRQLISFSDRVENLLAVEDVKG